jgi:20S proteasome subunit alpha 6
VAVLGLSPKLELSSGWDSAAFSLDVSRCLSFSPGLSDAFAAAPAQVGRLVLKVADKSQIGTQRIGQRPYGVGLLVAGADATGPHLYETKPSGQYFEYYGMAIGARSQAGRTYLEKHFESFADCSLDELITHALLALRETVGTSGELTSSNVTIGYVAEDTPFAVLEDDAVAPYVDAVKKPEPGAAPAAAPAAAPEAAAPAMETD